MWIRETSEKEPKGVFVIVHGAGEYHVRYEWVVQQLNRSGYHVIIGDLPGQGTTTGRRGHVSEFPEYFRQVRPWLREARGYGLPVIQLGHSMGGLISLLVQNEIKPSLRPDILVLSSPCLGLANTPPIYKRAISRVLNQVWPTLSLPSGLEPGSGTRDEKMRARDRADASLVKKVSVRYYRELTASIRRAHEEASLFPDLPLFVMQGGDDRIVDKEEVKRWFNALDITDKAYREWPGYFHEVLNDPGKEEVLLQMLAFVTARLHMVK
ncbi:alpha/beta fold hydrolase [Alteribacter natronophilus]|uniref:alpha/beta fold hydrolase n=1 Tax=Alteribacter natronophilus TaxID=2583810 RepID=UPI00110E9FC6|nr:alpha/beta fold hydrolase [Alteribacter natronophilus]TMW71800.1 alpha/beta hydrolase [Alteribacter natronophilus]